MKHIKQSVLDKFIGKDPKKIKRKDWKVVALPAGTVITMQLVRDTIYLWLGEDGKVESVTLGDPEQICD